MEQLVMDFHAKQGLDTSVLKPMKGGLARRVWDAHVSCDRCAKQLYNLESPSAYRAHLMLQELSEILEALHSGKVEGLADGLADLVYVAIGTAVQFGIPFDHIFLEVHRSNMTKGPVMNDSRGKDTRYSPPDIEGVLDANG